jgi:hypothetical protein
MNTNNARIGMRSFGYLESELSLEADRIDLFACISHMHMGTERVVILGYSRFIKEQPLCAFFLTRRIEPAFVQEV